MFSNTHAKLGNLLESKSDVFTQELIDATYRRKIDVVRSLLKDANPNVANKDGVTPLMIAASRPCLEEITEADEYIEIAKILLKAGADVNAQDKLGRTALMYVGGIEMPKAYYRAANIHRGIMTTILLGNMHTNVNLKDTSGKTALDYMMEECMKKREIHDGLVLLSRATNSEDRLAQFNQDLEKAIVIDKIKADQEYARREKETKEKNENLQQQYNALVQSCNSSNLVKKKGPKNASDWPQNMEFAVGAEHLQQIYDVIDQANLWESLKNPATYMNSLEMIRSHPVYQKQLHSGGSDSDLFSALSYINQHGWDEFCQACNKRSTQNSHGQR